MKKIFTLAMVLMALTANAQPKTINMSDNKSLHFIHKQFTFGDHVYFSVGKNRVDAPSSGSGTQTVTVDYDIYNDDIEQVKTIKIDYAFDSQLITGQSYDNPRGQYAIWDIVKDLLKNDPNITSFDDNNYRANTASGDDWYFYWNPSDQTLYEHRKDPDYYEWNNTTGSGPLKLDLFDADNGFWDSDRFIFSQTLFNDDDKFEWLTYSEDASGNPQINIVQEGGKVLQTIALPSTVYISVSEDIYVTILNGKTYLRFDDYDNTYFYLIDKSSTTGVRMKQVQSRALGSAIYNLRGQKVRSIPSDGIYIQNGRKVVIKK